MGKKLACALGLVLVLAIPAGAVEPPRASQAGPAPGTGRVLEIRVVEHDGATARRGRGDRFGAGSQGPAGFPRHDG